MIQRPLHLGNIPILAQQLHGVHLAQTVGPHVLRQPERPARPLDIRPDGLSRPVRFAIPTREGPDGPGLTADVLHQLGSQADPPPLAGFCL